MVEQNTKLGKNPHKNIATRFGDIFGLYCFGVRLYS